MSTPRTITCAHAITAPDQRLARRCVITIEGSRIADVADAAGQSVEPLLALPALVNAHDHGRAVRTTSVGAGNKPLESWLLHLALIPSVDPYLAAVVASCCAAAGAIRVRQVARTRGARIGSSLRPVALQVRRHAQGR